MCCTDISSVTHRKLYTKNYLVLLETSILDFHEKYNTPEIQKLVFYLPHMHILGIHHCGKELHEEFKCRIKQHDVYSGVIIKSG